MTAIPSTNGIFEPASPFAQAVCRILHQPDSVVRAVCMAAPGGEEGSVRLHLGDKTHVLTAHGGEDRWMLISGSEGMFRIPPSHPSFSVLWEQILMLFHETGRTADGRYNGPN